MSVVPRRALPVIAKLLVLVAATAALMALGFWQISRGYQKRALLERYQASLSAAPILLGASLAPPKPGESVPVVLNGTSLSAQQLLLDGQAQGDRPGFDVWTPVRLDDGAIVMVDRGWVALGERQRLMPPPPRMNVKGLWRSLPRSGFRLGSGNCAPSDWPRVVEYPNLEDLRCLFGAAVIDGIVLLDPAESGGFVRIWTPASGGLPPLQHFGYAVTWFALAACLLFLGLRLLFERK